jgi:hypothetical protein
LCKCQSLFLDSKGEDILNRMVVNILTLVKISCQLTKKIYVSTQFKMTLCRILYWVLNQRQKL